MIRVTTLPRESLQLQRTGELGGLRLAQAQLPSYSTAAEFLEQQTGSGWRLLGWTLARAVIIATPLLAMGIPFKQALLAALVSSGVLSLLVLVRLVLRVLDTQQQPV